MRTVPSLALQLPHAVVVSTVLVVIYIALIWLAVAYAVVRDAVNRSTSRVFWVIAAILGLFPPFFGVVIYWIIRPPATKDERRSQDLEEELLIEASHGVCPTCNTVRREGFLLCPVCHSKLANKCVQCGSALELDWDVCPFCLERASSEGTTPVARESRVEDSASGNGNGVPVGTGEAPKGRTSRGSRRS